MLSELSSAYQTIVFLIISGGKDDLTPQILQDIANILTLGTKYMHRLHHLLNRGLAHSFFSDFLCRVFLVCHGLLTFSLRFKKIVFNSENTFQSLDLDT